MIDFNSEAYKVWKSLYGLSYIETDSYNRKLLFYDGYKGIKYQIDNIWLYNDFEYTYLAWTEENGFVNLRISQLKPYNDILLNWTVIPAKMVTSFFIAKFTINSFNSIYQDCSTFYALKVEFERQPKQKQTIHLSVTELSELIHVKSNWLVGHRFYTDKKVLIFDLKTFKLQKILDIDKAIEDGFNVADGGGIFEELE